VCIEFYLWYSRHFILYLLYVMHKIKIDDKNQHKENQLCITNKVSAMSSIVYPSTFTAKSISISAPRTLQSGAKQAYLNYNGERLVMQTAVAMTIPFGLNCADKFGPPEYSIDVSFRGSDNRPEVKEFMDVMSQIDDAMITEGVKNSKAWFKADLNRDVVKAFYTPCVKYSKDKEGNVLSYPPNMKLKMKRTNDVFDAKIYDVNGTPYNNVPMEELLAKGVQVTAIMECGGVWFAGSKYGLTWRAKQVAVHQVPKKMGDFAFKGLSSAPPPAPVEEKDDDEDEVDDDAVFAASTASTASTASAASAASAKPSVIAAMMPQPKVSAAAAAAEPVSVPLVAPSAAQEVDDEDGDDVEPVPAPKKLVVKKKIVVPAKK